MGQQEEHRPEELRTLAGRCRFLASAMRDPDRSRVLRYAEELEELAIRLEQKGRH
jgi:hypothetical protein